MPVDTQKEVEQFMRAYAEDLLNHDREAIVNRLDPRGMYRLGNGSKIYWDFEALQQNYLNDWIGPEEFSWQDLSYEVLGPNTVVVAGSFKWKRSTDPAPRTISYTGLLLKQEGEWKIRLEDESTNPFEFVNSMLEMDDSPLNESLKRKSIDPSMVKEVFQSLNQ